MLKFHNLNLIKVFLGIGLLITAVGTAVAAANIEKGQLRSATSKIIYSANFIEHKSNSQVTLLKGNVELSINNKIKISADKVLVNYADEKQHDVAEFVIYGKGTLKDNDHSIQFMNGTFNPNTSQLSAEQIERKN